MQGAARMKASAPPVCSLENWESSYPQASYPYYFEACLGDYVRDLMISRSATDAQQEEFSKVGSPECNLNLALGLGP